MLMQHVDPNFCLILKDDTLSWNDFRLTHSLGQGFFYVLLFIVVALRPPYTINFIVNICNIVQVIDCV